MTAVIYRILSIAKQHSLVLPGLILLFAICVLGFFITREWSLLLIPFLVVAFAWGIQDFRRLYLMMWATIPFSIEIDLPGGLATDMPAEPLMWLTCFLLIGYLFLYSRKINFSFILHPVFIMLVIHFFWIILATIISDEPLISIKYTLAKSWYLVCFVLVPLILFRDILDFKQWATYVLIFLVTSIIIILIRHSQYGFTFTTINKAVIPIYRNHVDYACCLGVILPFIWLMRKWFESKLARIFLFVSVILITTGIYFSYTRAAWLCVPGAVVVYYIIRMRLMRIVIPLALGGAILITAWLAHDNRYLDYAPDYAKAITHSEFDDLISATTKMEDISTVERFYRWVAGYYMVKENPWTGYGPASFYSLYQNYVDRHFTTYVSDNPEHSGMHNYYLMLAVEQGLIGLAIFLILLIVVLLYGENLYHRLPPGPKKQLLMAALVSFCCNLFVLTLNDMVETDKLGSFFFFSIAIVILFGTQKDLDRKTVDVAAL
ncbi:MAG TPA: O-antigen ligase family protein [Saprospiraceae bacterium]|nr:O-antigen ligase family protein [Saprospiraceae bacterium]